MKANLLEGRITLKDGREVRRLPVPNQIELPPDTQLNNQLQKKLQEYEYRAEGLASCSPTDISYRQYATDALLKAIILGELLRAGRLEFFATTGGIEARFPAVDDLDLYNAWGVIAAYCSKDRGVKLLRGTGLPRV